ncbi:MAG TPA: hypothetical protein VGO13_08085 [Solirubrobacterales bacterium]|nr:hypothetical protein [Solirubrobacterales bacterium]
MALLAPLSATATDADFKHTYAFRLKASNGYSILAIAASQRKDGQGEAVLFVDRKDGGAVYEAPAIVNATRIDADLGRLGEIALDVVPSGKKAKLQSRCPGELTDPRPVTFEPPLFRGSFSFHGEEGFADASSASPHDYTRFFLDVLCAGALRGEFSGALLPGARLRVHSRKGSLRLALEANKNRPGAGTRFEVEVHEKRRGIAITRSRTAWVGAGAFDYDPLLRMAALAPPAPFAGHAAFRRGAPAASRWSGNLTVDLPGRSDVPLTGPGVGATLAHACWQGEGRGSRADCGF